MSNAPKTDLDDPNLHKDNPAISKILKQQERRRELYRLKKARTNTQAAPTEGPKQSGVCKSCNTLRSVAGICGC